MVWQQYQKGVGGVEGMPVGKKGDSGAGDNRLLRDLHLWKPLCLRKHGANNCTELLSSEERISHTLFILLPS